MIFVEKIKNNETISLWLKIKHETRVIKVKSPLSINSSHQNIPESTDK
jgi:hypothetical protein